MWSNLKIELKIRKIEIKYKNPHLAEDGLYLLEKSKIAKIDKIRTKIKNG